MSDPHQRDEGNPHPSSSHRTPQEIAKDETGPIGLDGHQRGEKVEANNGPVKKLREPPEEKEPQ